MSQLYWIGGAAAVPEVDDFTPANVEIGDTFTLTLKDEAGATIATVSFVATVATVANVTAGLSAAWAANATPRRRRRRATTARARRCG
jgi:hypothetical protein